MASEEEHLVEVVHIEEHWEDVLNVDCGKRVLSGAYQIIESKRIQGLPIWKRVDTSTAHRGYIYSLPCKQWAICEKESDIAHGKYVCTSAVHTGL